VGLLEDVVADADGTIARFREVVGEMQGYASFHTPFRSLL